MCVVFRKMCMQVRSVACYLLANPYTLRKKHHLHLIVLMETYCGKSKHDAMLKSLQDGNLYYQKQISALSRVEFLLRQLCRESSNNLDFSTSDNRFTRSEFLPSIVGQFELEIVSSHFPFLVMVTSLPCGFISVLRIRE